MLCAFPAELETPIIVNTDSYEYIVSHTFHAGCLAINSLHYSVSLYELCTLYEFYFSTECTVYRSIVKRLKLHKLCIDSK